MWKVGQNVVVSAYNKHTYTVKKCENECHRIIGVTQREKFKEARENLPENCYLFNEEALDISRALYVEEWTMCNSMWKEIQSKNR